jgi:hypothetical protein
VNAASALAGARFAAPQARSMGVACELPTFFRSLSVNCPGPATPLPPSRVLGRFVSGVGEAKTAKTKGFISPNETKGFALLPVSH